MKKQETKLKQLKEQFSRLTGVEARAKPARTYLKLEENNRWEGHYLRELVALDLRTKSAWKKIVEEVSEVESMRAEIEATEYQYSEYSEPGRNNPSATQAGELIARASEKVRNNPQERVATSITITGETKTLALNFNQHYALQRQKLLDAQDAYAYYNVKWHNRHLPHPFLEEDMTKLSKQELIQRSLENIKISIEEHKELNQPMDRLIDILSLTHFEFTPEQVYSREVFYDQYTGEYTLDSNYAGIPL